MNKRASSESNTEPVSLCTEQEVTANPLCYTLKQFMPMKDGVCEMTGLHVLTVLQKPMW